MPSASYGDQFFAILWSSRSDGVLSVKLDGFSQRNPETLKQFLVCAFLTVYARDLFNPSDPPLTILFRDRCVRVCHSIHLTRKSNTLLVICPYHRALSFTSIALNSYRGNSVGQPTREGKSKGGRNGDMVAGASSSGVASHALECRSWKLRPQQRKRRTDKTSVRLSVSNLLRVTPDSLPIPRPRAGRQELSYRRSGQPGSLQSCAESCA